VSTVGYVGTSVLVGTPPALSPAGTSQVNSDSFVYKDSGLQGTRGTPLVPTYRQHRHSPLSVPGEVVGR